MISFLLITSCAVVLADGEEQRSDFINAQLARLDRYVAVWKVTEHHFNAHGKEVGVVKGKEEIIWILDERVIQRTYSTTTSGRSFRAIGTLTWNDVEKKYHGVWLDNHSVSGPAIAKGDWDDDTQTMVYTVSSLAQDGSTVRHKVVERFLDDETRLATTYLLKGEKVVKRLEVHYKRAEPCKLGNLRTIDELHPLPKR